MVDKPDNNEPNRRERALSPKERQVLQLIREGHDTRKIAELLGNKITTVGVHRGNICAKLGASNVIDAVRSAIAKNLIPGEVEMPYRDEQVALFKTLSPREREILVAFVSGKTASEIAANRNISIKTVETHTARIKSKLGVQRRLAAVMKAINLGFTSLEKFSE